MEEKVNKRQPRRPMGKPVRVQKNGGEKKVILKPRRDAGKRTGDKKPAGKKIKPLKIVFLGGVGEIGKNMTAIECGEDIIVIDAGAIFPTDETPRSEEHTSELQSPS